MVERTSAHQKQLKKLLNRPWNASVSTSEQQTLDGAEQPLLHQFMRSILPRDLFGPRWTRIVEECYELYEIAKTDPVFAGTGFARKLTTIGHNYDREAYGKTTFERERDRIAKDMNEYRKRLAVRTRRMQEAKMARPIAQEYAFNEAFAQVGNYGLQAAAAQQAEWKNEVVAHVIDIAEDEMDEYEAEYNEDEDER
jgi:hypothetical protein